MFELDNEMFHVIGLPLVIESLDVNCKILCFFSPKLSLEGIDFKYGYGLKSKFFDFKRILDLKTGDEMPSGVTVVAFAAFADLDRGFHF